MLASFDPASDRKFWFEHHLKIFMKFAPDEFGRKGLPVHLHALVNDAAECYFLGLADQVRPVLESIISWIESHPEPDLSEYPKEQHHWRHGWDARYTWYQTLALCKWLSRGEPAQTDFANAIGAQRAAWEHASAEGIGHDPNEEQYELTEHLAMALAAGNPELGLKLFAVVAPTEPTEFEAPLLQFGQWACRHLAAGGKRDAEFIARGAEMLRASLLPNFFWTARRIEPALSLKAIYWDSGVTRTPEQTIAKAYDSMPGVDRPDFVPG